MMVAAGQMAASGSRVRVSGFALGTMMAAASWHDRKVCASLFENRALILKRAVGAAGLDMATPFRLFGGVGDGLRWGLRVDAGKTSGASCPASPRQMHARFCGGCCCHVSLDGRGADTELRRGAANAGLVGDLPSDDGCRVLRCWPP